MLEIAGGIVIAVIVLWVLAAFAEEILALLWGLIKALGAFYLVLGVIIVSCCLGVWGFHVLIPVMGYAAARRLADVVLGLLIFCGPVLFWLDSLHDFPLLRGLFRWLRHLPANLKSRFIKAVDAPE